MKVPVGMGRAVRAIDMGQSWKLVDRAWLQTNFPCMTACPVGTNAGHYIALIAEGRFAEAYRYAREPNPLASVCGRVCAHPCESACRRKTHDQPLAIRALKRFLTERYGPESPIPLRVEHPASRKLPYKVAVIGAGPAGLTAAHDLAQMGYSVTLFEGSSKAGGMLMQCIPEYRLPRQIVEAEVREILAAGEISLMLNQRAGHDFRVASLLNEGFDAVLIAVGTQRGRTLSIPGAGLAGVWSGIDFLRSVNAGSGFPIGSNVVVIGGGDTAMDVARTAARETQRLHKGGGHVHVVCLEQRHEMPAAREEIEAAGKEGIILHAGLGPQRILGYDGKVAGIETLKARQLFDAQGRFNPTFYEHTETQLECDTVLLAIGQIAQVEFLEPPDGVGLTGSGSIAVEPESLMTTAPGVFAAGDCAMGPRRLIDSVGDGQRAAAGIHAYLCGQYPPEPAIEVETLPRHQMPIGFLNIPRQAVPMLPTEKRTGMAEVELAFDEETARAEASRCLRCWINTVFDGNAAEGSRCVLCGGCVDVCPEDCLQLVPLDQVDFPNSMVETLKENRQLLGVELDDVAAEDLGIISGAVMLKDETRCVRCGLCAQRCPVKTITMEAYQLVEMT